MQDRHLCWPPYFFLGPAVALHLFNSRIATVLLGLIIANQSSLQRKIPMQERLLCWPPYFFPWPRSAPSNFFILESLLFRLQNEVRL